MSKSTTASKAPPSRTHSLTASRVFSRCGVQAPGRKVSFSNGVRVAPKILMPAVWARSASCLQPGDHLVGGDLFLGLGPAVAQIVGPQHDDDVGDPGLGDHIAVEAAQAAVAADVVQDPVAAEPLVHHPHRPPAAARLEPAGELVGPAAEGVRRRDVGVGQRVAERDHAAGLRRRPEHRSPLTKNQSLVMLPTGITAAPLKSPGGEM